MKTLRRKGLGMVVMLLAVFAIAVQSPLVTLFGTTAYAAESDSTPNPHSNADGIKDSAATKAGDMTVTIGDIREIGENRYEAYFSLQSLSGFYLNDLTFSFQLEKLGLRSSAFYFDDVYKSSTGKYNSSDGVLTVTPDNRNWITSASKPHSVRVKFEVDPARDSGGFVEFLKANPDCSGTRVCTVNAKYSGQLLATKTQDLYVAVWTRQYDVGLTLDEETNAITARFGYGSSYHITPEDMPFTATTVFKEPLGKPTSVRCNGDPVPEGAGGDLGYTYDADTRTLKLHGKTGRYGPGFVVSVECPISEEPFEISCNTTVAFTSVILDDESNPKIELSSVRYDNTPDDYIKSSALLVTGRDEEVLTNFDPATGELTWEVELNTEHEKLAYPDPDWDETDEYKKPVFSSVIANGQSYVEGSFKLDVIDIDGQVTQVAQDELTDVYNAENGELSLVLPAEQQESHYRESFTDATFIASYKTKLKEMSNPDDEGQIRVKNEVAFRGNPAGWTPQRSLDFIPEHSRRRFDLTGEAFKSLPPGSVTVTKTGGGKNLAGAEFELKCDGLLGNTWTKTYTGTTAADGTIEFDKLPQTGSYTLTETKAPDGYEVSGEPIKFSIPDKSGKFGTDKLKLSVKVDNKVSDGSSSGGSSSGGSSSGGSSSGGSSSSGESSSTPSSSTPSSSTPGGGSSTGGGSSSHPIINPPSSSETSSTPTPPTPPVVTPPDTPVGGDVDVPPGGNADVTDPPKNGDADVDDDGHWTYTPDPGYSGDDSFTITVKDPKGKPKKYDILVEIFDEPIPQSEKPTPNTGRGDSNFPAVTVSLAALGVLSLLMLRKKPA